MTANKNFKRRVRAYMAEHPGVSYAAAHRILSDNTQQAATPDRVRAQVTVTASDIGLDTSTGARSQHRWEITVDDPRTDKPRTGWIYLRRDVQTQVDELVAVDGWRRTPGVEWPVDPTSTPVEVELVRSDVGKRVDQVQAMYDATGLNYHRAHEPYIAAVAHELERCGVEIEEWFANPDEPRDGAIELAVPIRPYEETHFAWREDLGWYDIRTRTSGTSGDVTVDLPVGHLAAPFEVATAICEVLGHSVTVDQPEWRPPADYNPDAVEPEAWWDASPDLERALTCYTTYPGWKQADAPPANVPAEAPRTLQELDDFAHQVVNAFERLAGLPLDESPPAVVERDGNKLAVSILLPKDVGPTRLLGVDWSSDHGWKGIVRYVEGQPLGPVTDALPVRTLLGKESDGSGTEVFEADLALDRDTWDPATVAAEIRRMTRYYA